MDIAERIDHTMLKADSKTETIKRYCDEAKQYGFASVCVNSCHVPFVAKELFGSNVKTCCVVGFPLGAMLSSAKAFEASEAVKAGAQEIDMVINIGAMKDKNYEMVKKDILDVVKAAKPAIVKVIIETCLLTNDEKIIACQLSIEAGAAFVKTSTGFSVSGAALEDVTLMKKTVGSKVEVKASGGIRTSSDARAMLNAGADRIGTGNGIELL